MKKQTVSVISVIVSVIVLIFAGRLLTSDSSGGDQTALQENGAQVVKILARGGYSPRQSTAEAGKPLRLEIQTKGTYDCSSSLVIPDLNYEKQLSPTGKVVIDVPAQAAGTQLTGLCSMGMYSFTVNFK